MALYTPKFVIPDMRSGIGLGVVDVTQPMTVSWKINGASAMVAFSITIYQNDGTSTQLYTTGRITNGCPAYGNNSAGDAQIFSYTIAASALSSAGLVNGSEYKLIIQQWWSANDSITQNSASVFTTRSLPTLSISPIGTSGVIDSRNYTFTGIYAQAQYEVLNWFRWRIAFANDTANPFFDSGNITGTMDISCSYDGFFTGTNYAIRLTCQTESGVDADTGWVPFSASYSVSPSTGAVLASCASGTDAVVVDWSSMASGLDPAVQGFALYRRRGIDTELTKIAETEKTVFQAYDYGAASQQGTYTYYLFPFGATTYTSTPVVSNSISPCWWNWTLMECGETEDKKIFSVLSAFRFRLNVETGAMSNNNTPGLLQNFTPYPKVQLAPQNYKSGTLTAMLGAVSWTKNKPNYTDTLAMRDALYALSVTQNPLFIKSRKGDLLRVRVSAPITAQTNDATREQAQTISIQWVETGSTSGISLYALGNMGVTP